MAKKYLDSAGLARLWNKINSIFVAKEAGKGLSSNDYTDEDKTKLDRIEANANNYSLPVAGSELGGVKNGGDITIQSDGTMQVKDDSHNHVISNVDGLQSALDGKASVGHNHGGLTKVGTNEVVMWKEQVPTPTDDDGKTGWMYALHDIEINAGAGDVSNFNIIRAVRPGSRGNDCMLGGYAPSLLVGTQDTRFMLSVHRINPIIKFFAGSGKMSALPNWDLTLTGYNGTNITLPSTSGQVALVSQVNEKVDKVEGKGLSTNDYTTADKNKLAEVAAGAEVNTIVAVQRNGTAITPKDRVVNILVPVKTSELNNDSTYQTAADVAETIVGVKLDLASGIITLTRKNGTTFTLDLPTEKIIKSGRYDSETEEIVLVLEDESEIRFSASELIDEYYADESTLELYTDTADGNKKKFRIKTAYKNKIDGSEQTTNKTASVSASSTDTQYPNAKAVYNAVKDLATKVQTFSQASTRANIESGETISTIFGKSRKWFADLKAVAFSGSYNDLSDKPAIGNGTITIKQKGVAKGSFSVNQTGNATIELTDENTTYGIATSATPGLVKSGGDITIASDGVVSVNDNSHNHTIANVTGLQNALSEKLSTTGLANYARRLSPVVNQRNGTTTRYLEICRATVSRSTNYVIYDASFIINGGDTTRAISMQARIMGWKGPAYQLDEIILSVEQCSDALAINRLCAEYVHPTANEDGMIVVYMDTETNNYWNYSIIPLGSPYDRFKFVQSNQVYLTQGVASLPANGGTVIKGSLKAMATHDGSGNNIATSYLKLAGGNMTGNIRKKEGDYVALIPTKQYPSNYLQFMKITYVGANLDVPIEIRLSGRGSHQYIIQVNNASGGLNNVTFYTTGNSISRVVGIYYMYDSTAKTLSLMFRRAGGGGWEAAAVTDVIVPNNHYDKFTFDYTIAEVASSSGWTKAGMTTFHYAISERAERDGDGAIITDTYRKLSGVLELTDSNLATYFTNGTLTIPHGVTTVIFNTSAVKTVYLVKGTVQTNGYRLTIGGKWQPDTNSDYQGLEGCFPYYVDYHYLGHTGSSLPNFDAYSHFADYVYFNGMWFSKMY